MCEVSACVRECVSESGMYVCVFELCVFRVVVFSLLVFVRVHTVRNVNETRSPRA
jgi:hypothetical protein